MFKSSYIPKYFKAQELVAPEYFAIWGDDAFNLFDPHTLRMLDAIRRDFGEPITINNYHTGGNYKESGLRTPTTSTGAKRSRHKKAIAFDLKAKNLEVLKDFIALHSKSYFISRVEDYAFTKTWVHIEISTDFVDETHFFRPQGRND